MCCVRRLESGWGSAEGNQRGGKRKHGGMQQDGEVDERNKDVKRSEGESGGVGGEVSLWGTLQLLSPAHQPPSPPHPSSH